MAEVEVVRKEGEGVDVDISQISSTALERLRLADMDVEKRNEVGASTYTPETLEHVEGAILGHALQEQEDALLLQMASEVNRGVLEIESLPPVIRQAVEEIIGTK